MKTFALPSPRLSPAHERLNAIEATLSGVDLGDFAHLISEIAEVRQYLDAPPVLFVAGEFGAGKSSVINALLGDDLAPARPEPTTAVVTHFAHGERRCRLHFSGGRPSEDASIERWQRLTDQTHLSKNPADQEDAAALDHVEVWHPASLLKRVALVDAPGFNSPHASHDERTRAHLRSADLILWIAHATTAGKESELGVLGEARAARGTSPTPTLVFLNAADRVPTSGREAVRTLFAAKSGLPSSSVCLYSAKRARMPGQEQEEAFVALAHAALDVFVDTNARDACVRHEAGLLDALAASVHKSLLVRAFALADLRERARDQWTAYARSVKKETQAIAYAKSRAAISEMDALLISAASHFQSAIHQHIDRFFFMEFPKEFHIDDGRVRSYFSLRDGLDALARHTFGNYLSTVTAIAQSRARELTNADLVRDVASNVAEVACSGKSPDVQVGRAFMKEQKRTDNAIVGLRELLKHDFINGDMFAIFDTYYPGNNNFSDRLRDVKNTPAEEIVRRVHEALPERFDHNVWVEAITGGDSPVTASLNRLHDKSVSPALRELHAIETSLRCAAKALEPLLETPSRLEKGTALLKRNADGIVEAASRIISGIPPFRSKSSSTRDA